MSQVQRSQRSLIHAYRLSVVLAGAQVPSLRERHDRVSLRLCEREQVLATPAGHSKLGTQFSAEAEGARQSLYALLSQPQLPRLLRLCLEVIPAQPPFRARVHASVPPPSAAPIPRYMRSARR